MGADGTSKGKTPECEAEMNKNRQEQTKLALTHTQTQKLTQNVARRLFGRTSPYASGLCISSNGDGSVGAARAASTS